MDVQEVRIAELAHRTQALEQTCDILENTYHQVIDTEGENKQIPQVDEEDNCTEMELPHVYVVNIIPDISVALVGPGEELPTNGGRISPPLTRLRSKLRQEEQQETEQSGGLGIEDSEGENGGLEETVSSEARKKQVVKCFDGSFDKKLNIASLRQEMKRAAMSNCCESEKKEGQRIKGMMKRTSGIIHFESDMPTVPQATLEPKAESPQKPMPMPDGPKVQTPIPAKRKCKWLQQNSAPKLSTVKVAHTWEIPIPLEEKIPRLHNRTVKEKRESISNVRPVKSSNHLSPIVMVTNEKTSEATEKMVGPMKKGDPVAAHVAHLETVVKLFRLDEEDWVKILQLPVDRALWNMLPPEFPEVEKSFRDTVRLLERNMHPGQAEVPLAANMKQREGESPHEFHFSAA
ncbi:hypothetical protein UY3_18532 [Chelonia mydas]|uniref:Uncharacterized protein n=1 Tax=Chelonia mydas TaxID=8469 RepID=M7B7R6_CHEMY|nr:hypothetical protein UY3_18532 [Chelonia mydas]